MKSILHAKPLTLFPKKLKELLSYKASSEKVINRALQCLEERMKYNPFQINDPKDAEAYLRIQLASEENEVFGAIFLNCKYCLLGFEKLSFGTINRTYVHPRRVVQRALALNAAAVILTHNHPSGNLQPSQADIDLTNKLKGILEVIDVEVLDHFIVNAEGTYSFAKNYLI